MKAIKALTLLLTAASLAPCAPALCSAQRKIMKRDARSRGASSHNRGGVAKSDPAQLTEGQKRLVAKSRETILQTGITAAYFDEHFTLDRVVDEENNRQVEWLYAINGYEARVSDPIGYYTAADGTRVDIHGVKDALLRAHDVTSTIARARALQIMRACIGRHGATTVVFKSLELNSPARLFLVARELQEGKDPVTELPARGRVRGREGREEEETMLRFKVGFVDLESGRCKVMAGGVTG